MEILHWFGLNWFELIQTLGIIASLIFADSSRRSDIKSRRIANLIELTEQHRGIWGELNSRPELSRVLETKVDLKLTPVSAEEERFIRSLILHLNSAYHAMSAGVFITPEGLGDDIRRFFSRPIANAVWARTKPLLDKEFVKWVDSFKDGPPVPGR